MRKKEFLVYSLKLALIIKNPSALAVKNTSIIVSQINTCYATCAFHDFLFIIQLSTIIVKFVMEQGLPQASQHQNAMACFSRLLNWPTSAP